VECIVSDMGRVKCCIDIVELYIILDMEVDYSSICT
jgi:hypothetical protein